MKIALLIEKFGAVGGAEGQVGMLVRSLLNQGHSVRIFAAEVKGEIPGAEAAALGKGTHVQFAKAAKKAIDGQSFDIVHSFARTLKQDILRLGGGIHAEYLTRMAPARSAIGRWFSRINPKEKKILELERASFEPAATRCIQSVSNQVRDEAIRHYQVDPSRIVVTHNAVDLKRFTPDLREKRAAALKELGIPDDAFVALFAGAGFRRKGLAKAIEALPVDAWLLVVGGGSTTKYARLAKKKKARVKFLGSRSDIETWYGAADALVLPALYDPFPNVTLEAMACGVPVIVTRVAGVSEIITDGVDSFVVEDPGEPTAISNRLRQLMRGTARVTMGRAARMLAEKHPYDAYFRETLAMYERVRASR